MRVHFPKTLWLTDSWSSRLLAPLAAAYGFVVAVRRALYRTGILAAHRLPVPTIVVGNFLAGGTGKTPLVIALVESLRTMGFTPGVISRGHGGQADDPVLVGATDGPERTGDEPRLIHDRTGAPVCVGRDRVAAGRALLAANPGVDVILCDDGLQHHRLARDIEIAVFDARGVGNGRLLPAGPLRESPRPVDIVVRNGTPAGPGEAMMRLKPAGLHSLERPARSLSIEAIRERRIVAIAGIGDPDRFFATLRDLGVAPRRCVAFPDHHPYAPSDLDFPDADCIVMTEKDAVKCSGFPHPDRLFALRVDAVLDKTMISTLRARLPPRPGA